MRSFHGTALAAAALALAAQPAHAQGEPPEPAAQPSAETDAAPADEPQIVVTGYRRLDTPLQDEAVAASSLDEDVFRFSGSTDRIDVLRTVPGVTVLNLGGRSTVVIRGTSTAPDGDPNGAVAASYIGDVALSGLSGSRENVDLSNYDIDRIDVLRGPQGFSFGGGAMAGVVRTVPNAADTSESSGRIAVAGRLVEHGETPGYEIDGFVNVPLVRDTLGLRVTAYANREENPIYSTHYDRQGAPATVEGGRVSLRYEPTDSLTVDMRYVYEQRELMDFTRTDPALGDYVTGERRETSRRKTHLAWVNADWELGFATATYVGSYLAADTRTAYPVYWAAATADGSAIDYHSAIEARNFTQELRLGDADRHAFDWIVGAYYERRKNDDNGNYVFADMSTATTSEFDFDGVDDPALDNFTGGIRTLDEEQKALFGEVAWWFDDEWGLTLGTRYLEHSATSGYLDTIESHPEAQPAMIDTFPETNGWWKKVNLTWAPDGGQLYYLQFAQAERPGGTNYAALDASCPPEYADRVDEYYPGDEMTTFEGGAKVGFGRTAQINASAYYSRWKNAPTYTGALCGNGINYYIDNAGKMDLYGIEVDAQLRISRVLSASMSAAYGIAEIVEIGPDFTGGVPGDRSPGNPDWKVSGSLDYRDGIDPGLTLFGSAGFSYTGGYLNGMSVDWSTFASFVTFPGLDVHVIGQFPSGVDRYNDPGSGDYVLFDARIGLERGEWTGTLFVDNLLGSSKRSLINYLNTTEAGNATYTRVTPRTFGVRVEREF
ncbi:MAG TPA: TonB-dependent receptor plug domain-containing protein [Croceibacterium sp.]